MPGRKITDLPLHTNPLVDDDLLIVEVDAVGATRAVRFETLADEFRQSFLGAYATGSLPTGANVQVGDTAFDTTLGQLVVCVSTGPVVWSAVGGGGGGGGIYPAVDGDTVLAYDFDEATGAIVNDGIGGTDGDLVTVDAGVDRLVPVPGGKYAISYHNRDARQVFSAGGAAQQSSIDDLIISADKFTLTAFFVLTAAPTSNNYTRVFWKYAQGPNNLPQNGSPEDCIGMQFRAGNTGIQGYIRTAAPATFETIEGELVNNPQNVSWARAEPGKHMLVFVADEADGNGNRELSLYFDGKLAVTGSRPIPAPLGLYNANVDSGSWCVGSETAGSGNTISAVMCHARIDRVVRDAAWVEAAWRAWRGWA